MTAYRPDPVVDPQFEASPTNVAQFGALTGEDTATWTRLPRRASHAPRVLQVDGRDVDRSRASDRAHARPRRAAHASGCSTARLQGTIDADDAETFRAQMLTEMARMSVDDGLVMQIHPGSFRNHNPRGLPRLRPRQGRRHSDAHRLRACAEAAARQRRQRARLTIILFTLDETTYARELAPLAGHYPALKLGPPWWFHDSFQGMLRFLEQTIETAGFANTAGFNDDTRAFMSIPARHDVWRRVACRFLANCVVEHRFGEDEAFELAPALAHDFAKAAYRL